MNQSSLSPAVLQEILSILQNADQSQTSHVRSLLTSFRKSNEQYAKAFLKNFSEKDTALRLKYELILDLQKEAMDEHEKEIIEAMHIRGDAISTCFGKLNDVVTATNQSVDTTDAVSIKLESDIDQEECSVVVDHEDRNKDRKDDNIESPTNSNLLHQNHRKRGSATQITNDERPPKRRRLDLTQIESQQLQPSIEGGEKHSNKCTKSTSFPLEMEQINISGVWKYPADAEWRMILQENSTNGQVVGLMSFNNETQCTIEGSRRKDSKEGRDKLYYDIFKVHHDGTRHHYRIDLGANDNVMMVTKDGSLRAKTVRLETRAIPPPFEQELHRLRRAGNVSNHLPNNSLHSRTPSLPEIIPSYSSFGTSSSSCSNAGYNRYKHELKSANLTGLWKHQGADGKVRYVLFEDFRNGQVIGFMQHMEVTKSTITGHRSIANTFKVNEKIHDTGKEVVYELKLFPKENRVEMKRTSDPITDAPWVMHLVDKFIPGPLFQELEHLKRIKNYQGHRFL